MKIIPAVLPKRYYEIENAVTTLGDAVSTMQIDFVDGHVAPNRTWWFNRKDEEVLGEFEREDRGLPAWDSINYEFDLMVKDPLQYMDKFIMLGPSKIIFHLESFEQEAMISYLEKLPEVIKNTISFGMAIGIGTPPEDVAPFLPYITTIQCMGIAQIGYQGQVFDARAIAQVRRAKELYPDKVITVDGGVNKASIPLLIEAGATQFVVGSTIFGNEDPRGTMKELKQLCKEISAQENLN